MSDFILSSQNLPFTVALGIMIGLGLLELLSALLGTGASSYLDSILPDFDADFDIDADMDIDADVDAGGSSLGSFGGMLLWLNFGKVPFLILLVLFLFSFGIFGLAVQYISLILVSDLLPGLIASLPALIGGLLFLHYTGGLFAKIIPADETESVSETSFIGRTAIIIMGETQKGKPAQAKLKDKKGNTHYIMVEPQNNEDVFVSGREVLIVSQAGAIYEVVSRPGIGEEK